MNLQLIKFLSCFLNAQQSSNIFFFFSYSRNTLQVIKILKKEGYISHFKLFLLRDKKFFKIILKNLNGSKQKIYIKRVSKPSLPKFFSNKNLANFYSKTGLFILSTPIGILSSREAFLAGVGGSVLFYIS